MHRCKPTYRRQLAPRHNCRFLVLRPKVNACAARQTTAQQPRREALVSSTSDFRAPPQRPADDDCYGSSTRQFCVGPGRLTLPAAGVPVALGSAEIGGIDGATVLHRDVATRSGEN